MTDNPHDRDVPAGSSAGPAPSGINPEFFKEIRKIIHVDMDAFYASVEQRDNPELQGKPVAVGHGSRRGVVAAASYEARRFGVRSAIPSVTALRRCPDLIFVPPRFDQYKRVSRQIHEIFARYTALIEPLSLDEAYLDVTENFAGISTATEVASRIRADILAETGLTASAGISYNKFLAKMASGQNKPNGQFVIPPQAGPAFMETLPIGKFHGVGPATEAKMKRLGIETGADLKAQSLAFLQARFGKSGPYYYWLSRGVDDRAVHPHRERKSVGAEDTFSEDITSFEAARAGLEPLIAKVWKHCAAHDMQPRTATLKVKYTDFQIITRSRTLGRPIVSADELAETIWLLLGPLFPLAKDIRLLGVTLSSFAQDEGEPAPQLDLFGQPASCLA